MSNYGYTKKINMEFGEALSNVKNSLKNEGFGILTEIDVQKTMKEKIDKNIEPYVILGPCNPTYAHKALAMEPEIGLLLPCNVIVYESEGEVFASAINTKELLSISGNDNLNEVADVIREKLETSINNVSKE